MLNFNRETLENLHKRQVELNKQQDILNHEYSKYSAILHRKAVEVLEWKKKNLGLNYFLWHPYIKELRANCVVICIPDSEDSRYNDYFNVSFDEIFSDDWKEITLKRVEEKRQQKTEKERIEKENAEREAAREREERERAEYERLKAKFEKK